jgi:glycosyltransferase involved in cell wall biosynthesis
MTTIGVAIGTYGALKWARLAKTRALPSAHAQTIPADQVVHMHRATLQEARNKAVAQLTTEWVCVLDADDELDPGYLAAMREEMDRGLPALALLVPAAQYVHPSGECEPAAIPNAVPRRPLYETNTAVIGTLVRRELFDQVGGFGPWPILEDWELWLRCVDAGAVMVEVPQAIYRVHMSADGRGHARTDPYQETYWQIRSQYEG